MAEEPKKAARGGGKSEVVTIRLDPKLRYLAELAARKHRRSLSSFIEWAVEQSLAHVKLYQGTGYNNDDDVTIAGESTTLWDVDDAERFVRLAINYPDLLTIEEQQLWKMVHDSGLLNVARKKSRNSSSEWWDHQVLRDDVYPKLRSLWQSLQQAYKDGARAQREWVDQMRPLSTKLPKASSGFDDMDDDIPF